MSIEFELSGHVPAEPDAVFNAWLDSDAHSAMTGGQADVSAIVGDSFTAWDGTIEGKNLAIEPSTRILQLWRTAEFSPDEGDSTLEILFEAAEEGTQITIRHTHLPDHGKQYHQGWIDNYFTPMNAYFS